MDKFLTTILGFFFLLNATAQSNVAWDSICIKPAKMEREGDKLFVLLDLKTLGIRVKNQNAVIFTPYLTDGESNKELKPVGLYGKNRYIYYQRKGEGTMLTGGEEISFLSNEMPDTICYKEVVPYEPWMYNCKLLVKGKEYSRCQKVVAHSIQEVGTYSEVVYKPLFVYVSPNVEAEKTRSLSGTAFIDFPVGRTDILPEYRNNRVELDKILASINEIKGDKDATLSSIFIKGFASPEGSLQANERLSKKRVESLRKYVAKLCPEQENLIQTDYVAEDWEGLKKCISVSDLEHKSEILNLIDGAGDGDQKENEIKRRYPADYRIIKSDCYPGLRSSDYRVEYVVRSYSEIDEIKQLFQYNPKNLSLQEFYQLAYTYPKGSEAFNEVFTIAVQFYPNDEIANLNAANISMSKGNLEQASLYLQRAGSSGPAVYARGVYEALNKNYRHSVALLEDAAKAGVPEAAESLKVVRELFFLAE